MQESLLLIVPSRSTARTTEDEVNEEHNSDIYVIVFQKFSKCFGSGSTRVRLKITQTHPKNIENHTYLT